MRLLVTLTVLLSSIASAEAPSAFVASAGVGFLNRTFSWAGATNLTDANNPFSGAVAVDASWFPGAHATSGAGSWFGLFGQADFGLGMASRLANTEAIFGHIASRLRGGAVIRFPMGESAWLLVHGGYARQSFSTTSVAVNATAMRPTSPDVLFEGPRAGLGLRVKLGGTTELDLITGGQYVLGFGELGTNAWFPNATAFSVDAGLGLSFGLVEHVRLRLSGQWQRTFLTLGDSAKYSQADSASEQYISGAATLQWAM